MSSPKKIFFYNFSARNFPNFAVTDFDSMFVENGIVKQTGRGLICSDPSYSRVNLEEAIIFPPFADAHVHFLATGLSKIGCDLSKVKTIEEVIRAVRKESHKSEIILGWNFQESLIKENRKPNLAELDSICMTKIVWLARADLHSAVVNSAAINWANETLEKSGKFTERIPSDKNLITGKIFDYLAYQIIKKIPKDIKLSALKTVERECIENGVMTVHALEANEDTFEDAELVDNFLKNSPVHCVIYFQSPDPSMPASKGWQQMGGCLQVDGSIGSHTAALYEDYIDDEYNRGGLLRSNKEIMSILESAAANRLQLAMHAIGDKAVDCVSECYAKAAEKYGVPTRPHRIEHFLLPSFNAIANAKKANAYICVQPAYDFYWGGSDGLYAKRLGEKRAARCNPFKTLITSGLNLAAGSDSPATPINPLLGIHAFVNHYNEDERIDLNTALSLYINAPHRLSGESGQRGMLSTGFKADFICLNKDPFLESPDKLKDISVSAVYVEGTCIHKKLSSFSRIRRFLLELIGVLNNQ